MEDRRTISLALQHGERRQILLEPGTTLVVATGHVVLRAPMRWLAESVVAQEIDLRSEEVWIAEHSGWIDLEARSTTTAAILPPDAVSFWRSILQSLGAFFSADRTVDVKSEMDADAVLTKRL